MAQVLLITGGATGIGAASAHEAARAGYAVAINYRSHEARAVRLVSELRAAGVRALAVQGDVTRPEDVARNFDEVERELGPVTAVINDPDRPSCSCRGGCAPDRLVVRRGILHHRRLSRHLRRRFRGGESVAAAPSS